ncbi:hypothetical protein Ahy_A09g043606 isoform D [Arachis hypogaea]|uniref:Uncharacterized protein n=1 Tax=Arachis hypogaea TaxID=3818 RepID=A0A445BIQ8_ARAHY|nr:hypothetical protein Ahy_B09g096573 isoform D [Arachis hypogaea]RYR38557.1 hypothetical protein Ahy_A09g043606 isoform D [Arachis hypogaea]
MRIFLLFVED